MASKNTAHTTWQGSLMEGSGSTELVTSKVATFPVTWKARAESGEGTTNPEELIAAGLSTCYSMALSNALAQEGHAPTTLNVEATVTFVPGKGITEIHLDVAGDVPGLDHDGFVAKAEWAKDNCPVSQALASVPKTLTVA